jgi:hypothetical protein
MVSINWLKLYYCKQWNWDGSNPSSPNDNDIWMHSGATGTITLNYRVGGVTVNVEMSV